MSDGVTIVLHLGVHKTATTHVQSRLNNSAAALAEVGVKYIDLASVRNVLTNRLESKDFSAEDILRGLLGDGEYHRLIISDENILGGTEPPMRGKIYFDAARRLSKVLSVFSGKKIEVNITIRNYVDYYMSRYSEYLRHYNFVDFFDYYKGISFSGASWRDLLVDIKNAGIDELKVSKFEDVILDEEKYLNSLVGAEVKWAAGDNDPSTRRSKLTQQGYDVIKYFAERYSMQQTRRVVNLIDNIPQKYPATVFMPFDKKLEASLADRYAHDI